MSATINDLPIGSVRPTAADRVRQSAVVAAAVVALIGAFAGSGFAGGRPIPEAVGGALGPDATLVAPAGPAFAIWSVIYAGLAAFAIWQALPSQASRRRQRAAGWWMTASMLLTAAWILSVQAGLLALSVPVIAALLVALIVAFVRLRRDPAGTMADAILFDGTTGLFLGWVMVATVANIAAVLAASGFAGWGIDREVWGMAVLGVVAVIGSALAVGDRGRFAPAAASAWGLSWIGVSRLAGSLPSVPVAVAAFAAAGLIVLVAVVVRVVRG